MFFSGIDKPFTFNHSLQSNMFDFAILICWCLWIVLIFHPKRRLYDFRIKVRSRSYFLQLNCLLLGCLFGRSIVGTLAAHNCSSAQFVVNHAAFQQIPVLVVLMLVVRFIYYMLTPAIFSADNYKGYYYALSFMEASRLDNKKALQILEELMRSKKQLLELSEDTYLGNTKLRFEFEGELKEYARKALNLANSINKREQQSAG